MLRTKEQRLVGGRSFGFSTLFYAIAFTVGHQPKNRLHIYIYIYRIELPLGTMKMTATGRFCRTEAENALTASLHVVSL